jgi:hypothetical protein
MRKAVRAGRLIYLFKMLMHTPDIGVEAIAHAPRALITCSVPGASCS